MSRIMFWVEETAGMLVPLREIGNAEGLEGREARHAGVTGSNPGSAQPAGQALCHLRFPGRTLGYMGVWDVTTVLSTNRYSISV